MGPWINTKTCLNKHTVNNQKPWKRGPLFATGPLGIPEKYAILGGISWISAGHRVEGCYTEASTKPAQFWATTRLRGCRREHINWRWNNWFTSKFKLWPLPLEPPRSRAPICKLRGSEGKDIDAKGHQQPSLRVCVCSPFGLCLKLWGRNKFNLGRATRHLTNNVQSWNPETSCGS